MIDNYCTTLHLMQAVFIMSPLWESSGRELVLRSRICGFEPHWRHSLLSLSKTR